MLLASSSPVSSPNLFFQCEILCKVWSCKYHKNNLSVVVIHLKSDFSTVNWVAESEEIRGVYIHRNSLEYSNKRENTGLHAILVLSFKPNKLSQLQNTQLKIQYSDFPCHLKVVKINLHWFIIDGSVKKVKDWWSGTVNSFKKIDAHDNFCP